MPSPARVPVQVTGMLVVPENVHIGSPPFLKCGLAAEAGGAAMTNAASIIGSAKMKRSLLLMLFIRFESFPGRLNAGYRVIAGAPLQTGVQGRFLLRNDAFLGPTSLSVARATERSALICPLLAAGANPAALWIVMSLHVHNPHCRT